MPFVALFVCSTLSSVVIGKATIHLAVNRFYCGWADVFFASITHLGDGLIFLITIPIALFLSVRFGFALLISGLFTGIFTLLSKKIFFANAPRPLQYFNSIENMPLRLVPGVDVHHWNSFPSGHTMAAFAIYFVMANYFNGKYSSFMLFVLAFLVGFSRMYLSQHFITDVAVGALLGVGAGSIGIFLANKTTWEKSLISLMQKRKNEKSAE